MGIFDSLFGGEDKKQKSSSETQSTTDKVSAGEQASISKTATQTEGKSTQQQTQTQQSFQLTPEQMNTLDTLINRAAAKETVFSSGTQDLATTSSNVAQFIGQTLQNQPNVDELVLNAKNAAKLDFQENVAPSLTQFAQATGSEANTAVQMLRNKAGTDLATKLAGLETDIRLRAGEQQISNAATAQNAILGALSGQQSVDLGASQALQDTLAALGIAKGATGTTIGKSLTDLVASQKGTESKLTDTLTQDKTKIITEEESKSKGKGSSSGSLLNLVNVLLSNAGSSYGTPA